MGIRRARNRARRLLEELAIRGKPPVNIYLIAKRLSIEVVERPNLHLEGHEDVSALLLRRKGRNICVVNADDAENRKRFSIAHEIGHFFLHPFQEAYVDPKFSVAARDGKSSEGIDFREIEANAFAAELLMPSEWLHREVPRPSDLDLFDDDKIKTLANRYKVSVQAMTYRLTNLGLLAAHG